MTPFGVVHTLSVAGEPVHVCARPGRRGWLATTCDPPAQFAGVGRTEDEAITHLAGLLVLAAAVAARVVPPA